MLGSLNRDDGQPGGPVSSDTWFGKLVECELCGETQRCFTRFGLVTCERCQRDFLPRSGGLYTPYR